MKNLAAEFETRPVGRVVSHLSLALSLFSAQFSLNNTSARHLATMEIEDTLTLSGEERISQRKSEDDIIRRYIGSFTFPNISYLFGLQNAKVRQINKQKS